MIAIYVEQVVGLTLTVSQKPKTLGGVSTHTKRQKPAGKQQLGPVLKRKNTDVDGVVWCGSPSALVSSSSLSEIHKASTFASDDTMGMAGSEHANAAPCLGAAGNVKP